MCLNENKTYFNQHLPSGPVHPYQLDESISNILGVSGILFHFYYILNRNSCKRTVKTLLIRRRILRSALFAYVPKMGRLAYMG